jgi:hypothetical protein
LAGLLVQLGLTTAGIASARDPAARDLPIGVAGPNQVVAPVAEQLQSQVSFSVTIYPDEQSAAGPQSKTGRSTPCSYRQPPKLLIASAASPAGE